MKKNLLLAAALSGAALFAGCEYDEDDHYHDHAVRHVSVTSGTPVYYGDFDEYTPYYSYSGRRYYRTADRYVYYTDRRPYYVRTVPTSSVYINPPRRVTTVHRVY
jgi:hypothetical protein